MERTTRKLKLERYPEVYDYRRALIYDRVIFVDEVGNHLNYIGPSCSGSGRSTSLRSKLLRWAWRHGIGDEITVRFTLDNGAIINPSIVNEYRRR